MHATVRRQNWVFFLQEQSKEFHGFEEFCARLDVIAIGTVEVVTMRVTARNPSVHNPFQPTTADNRNTCPVPVTVHPQACSSHPLGF